MSVLIKGLRMPTEDEIIIRIQPSGAILDQCGHRILQKAIQVPPHGRLIDADALKDLYHYNTHDSDIDKAWTGNIRRSIDSAPTVLEAEEVYGQHTDTAGNLHWTGTRSGEHKIKAEGTNHD